MSKALVIKGANFSANKIETITIFDPIPCTGLTLSSNSITFSAIGASQTLTATATPFNTTDTVEWQTSDSNCATVSNGVVTCVGVGTAVITAICGEQSATCAVSASVSLDMSTVGFIAHKALTSTDLSLNPPKNYMSVWGGESGSYLTMGTFYSTVVTASGIRALMPAVLATDNYPFMLPNNTSHIVMTIPDTLSYSGSSNSVVFGDSTEHYTYNTDNRNGVLAKTNVLQMTLDGKTASYDVPDIDGIDCCLISIRLSTQIDEIPAGLSIVFS